MAALCSPVEVILVVYFLFLDPYLNDHHGVKPVPLHPCTYVVPAIGHCPGFSTVPLTTSLLDLAHTQSDLVESHSAYILRC